MFHYYQNISFFFILIATSNCLVQTCEFVTIKNETAQQCNTNSHCSSTNYCTCDSGYFANCLIEAKDLTESEQLVNITMNMTYFKITPNTDDDFYVQMTICHKENYLFKEKINFWTDNGSLSILSENDISEPSTIITAVSNCLKIASKFYRLGNQPNGEPEFLIIGIALNEGEKVQATLKVQQKQTLLFQILMRIIAVLLVILLVTCSGAIGFCLIQIRRRRFTQSFEEREPKNNIDYFNIAMPKFKLNDPIKAQQVCSVCLIQMGSIQYLRKTFCNHTFHAECLDLWCLKHLTCPVCRCQLDHFAVEQQALGQCIRNSLAQPIQMVLAGPMLRQVILE